jgi:hypothetical protein
MERVLGLFCETTRIEHGERMADTTALIYGRNRRASLRFFWIAVAVCVVTATTFFVRAGPYDGS